MATSDIDELLEWMSKAAQCSDWDDRESMGYEANKGDPPPIVLRHSHDADRFARWIVAVKGLQQKAIWLDEFLEVVRTGKPPVYNVVPIEPEITGGH